MVAASHKAGTPSQAKQPLLLLTPIHDQHEHARVGIKFPTCCRGPSPSLPHSLSADSVWLCSSPAHLLARPHFRSCKERTQEDTRILGYPRPNGWGRWSLFLCLPINILFSARTSLGWSGAEEINFLMVIHSRSILLLSSQLHQRNEGVTTAREGLIYTFLMYNTHDCEGSRSSHEAGIMKGSRSSETFGGG